MMRASFFLLIILCIGCIRAQDREYSLSEGSELYNTHYFFFQVFPASPGKDTVVYVNSALPSSFVIEHNGLDKGEKTLLLYNDTCKLLISKIDGCYIVNKKKIKAHNTNDRKLLLYFVNSKVVIYSGEVKAGEIALDFNHLKRIGVALKKNKDFSCKYLGCYEPCEFREMDYGKTLDDGVYKRIKSKMTKQGVDDDYSLTFPDDIRYNSPRSIRFEYRFEDSKKEGKTKTQRGRSEISGVHSSLLMGKWIVEFDLYIPHETIDDGVLRECITQLHDNSTVALSPAFSIGLVGGELYCRLRGDSIPIEQWEKRNRPAGGTHISTLGYLKKDTWHHVKIYLKLAYQRSMNPQTIIWIDSEKVFESNWPNCYNYEPKKAGVFDYIKFGIYKSGWLGLKKKPVGTDRRIYYFDNYRVKY